MKTLLLKIADLPANDLPEIDVLPRFAGRAPRFQWTATAGDMIDLGPVSRSTDDAPAAPAFDDAAAFAADGRTTSRLVKWPSADLLRGKPTFARILGLLSARALTLKRRVGPSGVHGAACGDPMGLLGQRRLLIRAEHVDASASVAGVLRRAAPLRERRAGGRERRGQPLPAPAQASRPGLMRRTRHGAIGLVVGAVVGARRCWGWPRANSPLGTPFARRAAPILFRTTAQRRLRHVSRVARGDESDDPPTSSRRQTMTTIRQSLDDLLTCDGAMCCALVDSDSGMMLGSAGSGVDLEVAAAGNTEVMRAKRKTMRALGLDDTIDDILITLGKQYHLIRPTTKHDGIFLYFVLDKSRSNLALARRRMQEVDKSLAF